MLLGDNRAEMQASVFTARRDEVAKEEQRRRHAAKMFGFGAADIELLPRAYLQPWKDLLRDTEVRRQRERQRVLLLRALTGVLANQTSTR